MLYHREIKKKLKRYLVEQDSKMMSMFTWCGIGALGSYLILTFYFFSYFSYLKSNGHFYWTLMVICFLFIASSRIAWKNFTYKPVVSRTVIEEFLNFDLEANNKRLKLLSSVVICYSLCVQAGCLYCLYRSNPSLSILSGEILCIAGMILSLKLYSVRKYIINYIELVDHHLPDR